MTYAVAAVGFVLSLVAILMLLVAVIGRLDKWGRKHGLTIVVPEHREPANVIVLDERRAS